VFFISPINPNAYFRLNNLLHVSLLLKTYVLVPFLNTILYSLVSSSLFSCHYSSTNEILLERDGGVNGLFPEPLASRVIFLGIVCK